MGPGIYIMQGGGQCPPPISRPTVRQCLHWIWGMWCRSSLPGWKISEYQLLEPSDIQTVFHLFPLYVPSNGARIMIKTQRGYLRIRYVRGAKIITPGRSHHFVFGLVAIVKCSILTAWLTYLYWDVYANEDSRAEPIRNVCMYLPSQFPQTTNRNRIS